MVQKAPRKNGLIVNIVGTTRGSRVGTVDLEWIRCLHSVFPRGNTQPSIASAAAHGLQLHSFYKDKGDFGFNNVDHILKV
jgi:hypothetical protein